MNKKSSILFVLFAGLPTTAVALLQLPTRKPSLVTTTTTLGAQVVELNGYPRSRYPFIRWACYELNVEFACGDAETSSQNLSVPDYTGVEVFDWSFILKRLQRKHGHHTVAESKSIQSWIMWSVSFFHRDMHCGLNRGGCKPETWIKQIEVLIDPESLCLVPEAGFTLADVAVSFSLLDTLSRLPRDKANLFPVVLRYVNACISRPAYRRAFGAAVQGSLVMRLSGMESVATTMASSRQQSLNEVRDQIMSRSSVTDRKTRLRASQKQVFEVAMDTQLDSRGSRNATYVSTESAIPVVNAVPLGAVVPTKRSTKKLPRVGVARVSTSMLRSQGKSTAAHATGQDTYYRTHGAVPFASTSRTMSRYRSKTKGSRCNDISKRVGQRKLGTEVRSLQEVSHESAPRLDTITVREISQQWPGEKQWREAYGGLHP